ncbi:MerR family transcriptional regulator [Lacticaseibacillus casei]|uniref:MerR family transcriptional regulator n=1 Tax=Lacticaseibacillus huelsenbergensis TaxID=3035291 RepID=A0ABY8DM98_9LACO|nr:MULTISPECIES: MerR family transcriptional regulator [Lacticaseibacillus]MDG3061358.1 MerR family transcriptional regulator [Lacticaseibacillus sp. BCRC 81376]QVI38620.1 MerR family transcriptional regulator [Lacticaseibacillus casei]QXG60348.1 MerR family transcriptional regulator [Lacticaseibacillus casei]WFB38100.1 MerR family transcriptional regulator [Lacticaseibacillus huelsenbergensis]WFB42502.1 MerR family transcriptional regulator [Lacticaseibacillus huelsenbergensis]
MSVSYTIGEVAAITHLSVPTIRYYDKEGLIPDLQKDQAGVRCFTDQNLGALEMINCLKTAGMSIKDIRTFMQWNLEGDATLTKRLDFFNQLHTAVENQMKQLEQTLNTIEYKQHYYRQAVADGTEKYVKTGTAHVKAVATEQEQRD